jgi:uncharacterized protein (TIGR00730 family)
MGSAVVSPTDKDNPLQPGLSDTESERVDRISDELREGIESLSGIGPAVSIFGSARSTPDSWEYRGAHQLARRLSAQGISVVTGGGPGVMEAANLGAREEVGTSVGLNIELPHEQLANPYLDIDLDFRYFFTRKFLLIRNAIGFAIFPGGFGTVDELFELLTLVQTGKLKQRPIVLIGADYWEGLYQWLQGHLQDNAYIGADDLKLVEIVDDVDVAVDIILGSYRRNNP